ncbi:MHYT domain-containing protein [Streptomyces sp. DSM 44915]|uniref:MHYT domain-containing protein n=2 Tax=Streptomyces chisholmiae TaxID=3075540 RepID=A0ABU2JVH8_9ACTN|nr:MHYT domain-containing protein [Streptomyces sp. DSM 44915]MDT0268967.1 MHYT domain-containing protein [Streptomyces sp. DSM 44915]
MAELFDDSGYDLVTPVAAYLMAFLGSALGLRCTTRAMLVTHSWRPGWLALGAGAIGSGIWTMHFIAMLGFHVPGGEIRYDLPLTFLSLGVAVVVVGIGVFVVGYRGASPLTLGVSGLVTGLGVAAMHYLGMAAMRVSGSAIHYDPLTVAASVVIAVVAATAALWAAVQVRGMLWSLAASLIMGVAVTGMHYTGMAALTVHRHAGGPTGFDGVSSVRLVVPMLVGPMVFLLLAAVIVMFDPLMVMGTPDEARATAPTPRRPASPAATPVPDPHRPLRDWPTERPPGRG